MRKLGEECSICLQNDYIFLVAERMQTDLYPELNIHVSKLTFPQKTTMELGH